MKKRSLSLLLILALLLSLSACGAPGGAVERPSGSVRTVTDDCGREVEIPTEIQAIVPSGPLSQIVLFAIAPELFVGLASRWSDSATGIIADRYLELPCFGQLYDSADLNVEELALVGPELIVDVGEAKGSVAEDMDALQARTGIPSVHVEATLATMPRAFRTLGSLLGREEKGEELAQFCERVYTRTLSVMEQVGDDKITALYILGSEGQNVLAKGSYHAEVLDLLTDNLAVMDNPAGKGTGNTVTLEQIALWDPEFLLFASGSIYGTVSDRDAWKELSAVRSGNYAEVPDGPHSWMGNPPSVQRYLSLIWLTAALYPEFCTYDAKAEILEYYRLFYGCVLTGEQYAALTARAFPPAAG